MQDMEYEQLVAAWLLRDAEAARQWGGLVLPHVKEVFGHYALQDIVERGLRYFLDHGEHLGRAGLAVDLDLLVRPGSARAVYSVVLDELFALALRLRDHIGSNLAAEVRKRIVGSVDVPSSGKPEDIERYIAGIRGALAVGQKRRPKLIHERIEVPDVLGIGTPFPSLNRLLPGGGLGPGEMGVVQASYGVGKTRFLMNIADYTSRVLGVPTLFVFYEDSEYRIRERFEKMAGRPLEEVFGAPPMPVLAIRHSPDPTYGPEQIQADLDEMEGRLGCRFGVVCRDYGELAVTDNNDWRAVVASYLSFGRMLGSRGICGWDAMQENRYGNPSFFDIAKPIQVQLELDELATHLQEIHVRKNRNGPHGIRIRFQVDTATGRLREPSDEYPPERTFAQATAADGPGAPAAGRPGEVQDAVHRGASGVHGHEAGTEEGPQPPRTLAPEEGVEAESAGAL